MAETAQENIVSLEDYGHRRDLGKGPGAQILRDVYRIAMEALQKHIGAMMDKVDDVLFERAEKAENNSVQNHYFEAMRELRIVRKDIEESFATHLNANFSNGVPRQTEMAGDVSLSWEEDTNGLGLVDTNDLEESLAISNLVNKIRGNCGPLLFPLDRRIGFLIGDPDLERWQNPLGPESVCEAFKSASELVESGTDIRLIIYKLFDYHVGGYLEDLYTHINQHLANLGVLPRIKVTIPRKPGHTPESSVRNHGAPGSATRNKFPGHEQSHHDLPSLPTAPGILPGNYDFSHSDPAINVLTLLQHNEHSAATESLQSVDGTVATSGRVNILHEIRTSSLIRNLGEHGDMTIGVVAMIFDYILDDENIPDPMRALIGRLQIPILKVALLDQTFLTRKSHPARRFLNRLAVTALGWDEQHGSGDPVYIKIQSAVQLVLEQFEDDVSLFENLLSDFDEFLAKEEAQAQLRADRSAKVMEGQERLEVAKTTTMEEIGPRVEDSENVDFVREFVGSHWKNLLFICCARNGKDSDAWRQAVATMDDLIWSIKPKRTPEDRKRLVALQPKLLESLRHGMERLAIPATERDNFIAKLVRAHGRTAAPAASTETPADRRPEQPAEKPKPATPSSAIAVSGNTTASPSSRRNDGQYLQQVESLKPGIWLEFAGADGKATRAKLSWISPITGTFLFTDRQGLKAGNYTTDDLVKMLRDKLARVIDTAPLMDRAVSTVLADSLKS